LVPKAWEMLFQLKHPPPWAGGDLELGDSQPKPPNSFTIAH
jgi:hypothetical protein